MGGILRALVFPGAQNLPLWRMAEEGRVELRLTASRQEQIERIAAGEVEVIHTAPGNLEQPDARRAGLRAFMGGSAGPLFLVAGPRWPGRRRLAVDDPGSGFAPLAYRWLARAGLPEESRLAVGGTGRRWEALQAGEADLAVLHPPFSEWAEQAGFRLLARLDEGRTLVGASRPDVPEEALRAYVRAYRRALAGLMAEPGEAARLLEERAGVARELAPATAERLLTALAEAGTALEADSPFDRLADRYEAWFERHPRTYAAEKEAVRQLLTPGRWLEVGVGSGRFAAPLGIRDGVEPARAMRRLALARGVRATEGVAEELPYGEASWDGILMVTTVCFVDDLARSLEEARRVLRPGGALVIGLVDRLAPLGRLYERQKEANPFYRSARFYSVAELATALRAAGFALDGFRQTLFRPLEELEAPGSPPEPVEEGHGRGSFVALRAVAGATKEGIG
ncbi:MAG: methyltransferase domain-containing protein [Bacillota bacterium]|nr:methyltransferase domain-containing protein [Bacillota bacterium]